MQQKFFCVISLCLLPHIETHAEAYCQDASMASFLQVWLLDGEQMQKLASMVQQRLDSWTVFRCDQNFVLMNVMKNAFYCGYDYCDTMVKNVFAYSPDGKVFFAVINFPGSWADGSLNARSFCPLFG